MDDESSSSVVESGLAGETVNRTDAAGVRIVDVFALMTVAAVGCALLVPVLRVTSVESQRTAFALIAVQVLGMACVIGGLFAKRSKAIAQAGRGIGRGMLGEMQWKYWPEVLCVAMMLFLGLTQFGFAFVIGVLLERSQPNLLIYVIQCLQFSWLAGLFWFQWISRAYPGTIEFWEQGVMMSGYRLFPWSIVEANPSTLYADRIVLHLSEESRYYQRQMYVVRIPERLRETIFSLASKVTGN